MRDLSATRSLISLWLKGFSLSFAFIICLYSSGVYAQRSMNTLKWQVLGDVSARYEHTYARPPSFILGDIDIWFQSQIFTNWRGMGEIMLMDMNKQGDPDYMIHPGRLFIEYIESDSMQLRIGQTHTPIGLYSQLYPHGARFFEPTIHRPLLGGVKRGEELLPLHTIGLRIQGDIEVNKHLELKYIVGLGNGDAHGGIDLNFWKAPYFQIQFLPLEIDGLSIAFSGYIDKLDGIEELPSVTLHQVITNASVYYNTYPFSILLETFWMKHAGSFSEALNIASALPTYTVNGELVPHTSLFGGYLQTTYMLDDQNSFFGLAEVFTRSEDDALFNEHIPYNNHIGFHAGHSYLFNQNILLKTGYKYSWSDNLHRFDMQLAYRL